MTQLKKTLLTASFAVLLLTPFLLTEASAGVAVVTHPASGADLETRWRWALERDRPLWIGYAIERPADTDAYPVSIRWTGRMGGAPIGETLAAAGVRLEPAAEGVRPFVILASIDRGGELRELDALDPAIPYDFERRPLVWLGRATTEESFAHLETLYRRAEPEDLRESLVEAISFHDLPAGLDFLDTVLHTDPNVQIRAEAAESLGVRSEPRAVEILLATARSDAAVAIRIEAAEALGETRAPGADAALLMLTGADVDRRVRAEAAEAMGERSSPESFEALRELLWNDPDRVIREEALEALGAHSAAGAQDAVIEAARSHPDAQIREEAIEVLSELAARQVGELSHRER